MSEWSESQYKLERRRQSGHRNSFFIFAEELFSILNEADEDDDGGTYQTDEEHPG
jgi:hypothetical protein